MLCENKIRDLLCSAREISELCSQNGWIDSSTLSYEIKDKTDNSVLLSVSFEEIVMEGSGCVADRITCYGQVRLDYDGSNKPVIVSVSK